MALTQEQSAALMQDSAFRGRIKVCCLKYANTIPLEPAPHTRGYTSALRWTQQCIMNPDQTAQTVQSSAVMDPAVQDAGSQIGDVALQGAVESVVNGNFI